VVGCERWNASESGVSTGVMLRYGHNLDDSYRDCFYCQHRDHPIPLPVNRGWFVYTALNIINLQSNIYGWLIPSATVSLLIYETTIKNMFKCQV